MKIKFGKYEVLDSGTIVGVKEEPLDFIIEEKTNFIVRLVFVDDKKVKDHHRKAQLFGDNGVEITFTNYNNSLGTGNAIPLEIGRLQGKRLYFNFRIQHLNSAGKTIHYSWLLGEEVES